MQPTSESGAVPLRDRGGAAFVLHEGDYVVRLAVDGAELRAAQQLRFAVFNLELGEGFAGADGVDQDRFDAQCDHLLLLDRATARVVGTYRLQTAERARTALGFYCNEMFDLDRLPLGFVERAVELGRACIHADHRHGSALFGLWRGIAAYLAHHHKHLLFGCCSLTGTDPALGLTAARWLREQGHFDPHIHLAAQPLHACRGPEPGLAEVEAFRPPRLFWTYLRYGARVCSEPAIDHAFGTVDFLVVLDTSDFEPKVRELFFGP